VPRSSYERRNTCLITIIYASDKCFGLVDMLEGATGDCDSKQGRGRLQVTSFPLSAGRLSVASG
jgi:hypothetical protein